MKVWIDRQLIFEEVHVNELTTCHPVRVHCNASPIEVKSVLVKRVAEK